MDERYFVAPIGKTEIRILPLSKDLAKNSKIFAYPTWLHFAKGDYIVCFNTLEKQCQICDFLADQNKDVHHFQSRERYYVNIFHNGQVQIWQIGNLLHDILEKYMDAPQWSKFQSPENGYNWFLIREGLRLNTKYTLIPSGERAPLTIKNWQEKIYDFQELFQEPTQIEIEEFLLRITQGN